MSLAAPARARTLTPGELAWLAALPCALVTLALIVVVGPPLGHAFLAPRGEPLWPSEAVFVFGRVEPVKHGRYVVSLLGPALLAAAVLAGTWRAARFSPRALAASVVATEVALAALLLAAVLGQNSVIFPLEPPIPHPWHVFGPLRYAFALAAPLALVGAMRRAGVAERVAAAARETRTRRYACAALAVAVAAIWLLPAVDTDGTIGRSPGAGLIPWTMDDTFAILNGSGPLIGFHAMYAHLWPYATAATMTLFGATVGVFTVTLVLISGPRAARRLCGVAARRAQLRAGAGAVRPGRRDRLPAGAARARPPRRSGSATRRSSAYGRCAPPGRTCSPG